MGCTVGPECTALPETVREEKQQQSGGKRNSSRRNTDIVGEREGNSKNAEKGKNADLSQRHERQPGAAIEEKLRKKD